MAKTTSKKKGTTKKKTTTKSTAKKKTTTSTPKSTKAKSTAAQKKPAAKKKPTIKELLAKKFDTWQPETLYAPPADDPAQKEAVAAPPFVPKEMAEEVRPLLFKKFDLSEGEPSPKKAEAPAKEKAEKKAPEPRKKEEPAPQKKEEKAPKIVSQRELLQKKFGAWKPSSPFKPNPPVLKDQTAPPFADGEDGERIRSLLMKKFDLSDAAPVEPTPPPEAEAPPREEKAPVQAPEPEAKAPEPEAEPPKAVSHRELLQKRFDAWKPSSFFKPTPPAQQDFTAPPIASGSDAERIRSLLLQKIDLSDIPPRPPAAEVPEAEVVDQKTEVPEEVKTAPGEPAVEEAVEEKTDAVPEAEVVDQKTEVPEEVKTALGEPAVEEAVEEKTDAVPEAEVVDQKTEVPEEVKTAPGEPAVEEAVEEKTDAVPEAEVVNQKTEVPEEVKTAPGEPAVEEVVEEKKAEQAEEDVETREAVPPPTVKKGSDPMETTMKFFAACLAVVFALILWASFSNASKYYLVPVDQGMEIWKGSFAPLGKERVVRLPDVSAPGAIQPVYSREEVYPLAFDYYINKADAILVAPGTPNYDAVEKNLNRAVDYSTKGNAKLAFSKMKDLRLIILMNKADIAATRGTEAGLKEALAYLEQAAAFDGNDLLDLKRTSKAELIERKIEGIRSMLQNVQQPPALVPEPTPAS